MTGVQTCALPISFGQRSYQNMVETVKYLQRNPKDREVIETAKYYYGNHCSMHDMEILGEFLYEVGEQEWKKEWDKRYFSDFDIETIVRLEVMDEELH